MSEVQTQEVPGKGPEDEEWFLYDVEVYTLPQGIGAEEPAICSPEHEGCGFITTIHVNNTEKDIENLGKCPCCYKNLRRDWSRFSFGHTARGPGFHSTKYGMRRKKDMIARNERLKRTQWDDHQPVDVPDPDKIRNPTPGGPYDPNGPFQKKKGKTVTSLPSKPKKG